MFGSRRRAKRDQLQAAYELGAAEATASADQAGDGVVQKSVRRAWSDGFGFLATRALQILIVLAVVVLVIWGLRSLTTVVIPILLALIFASTFAPVTSWLTRHRVPSALIAVILLLGILAILGGVGWLIYWAVQAQWEDLSAQAQDGFTQVVQWANSLPFIPDESQLLEWRDGILDFVTSAQFGSGALAGVGVVTSFITGLVLMVVILFFFLKDGPKIWYFLLRPFTGEPRKRAERIGVKTVETLGSYVRGTASVAAVDAIGIGVGLAILQVPLALPLGVLVFILAFIPIVGATVAGILAALVALVANGPINAVAVVAVVVAVNQLEGNFLQPVLMGRSLKLHSLVILLALTIGTVLSGILGAVLAVPIAAVAWGAIQVWDGADRPAKWAVAHPGDA